MPACKRGGRIDTPILISNDEGAARLREATELAPLDFTVARAAMPLTGRDPFGEEFLALYDDWIAAGSPYHGLNPDAGRYRAG